jgi:hypothetical protein
MLTRCAIVELSTGNVVNVVEYETVPEGTPPGMDDGVIAIPSDSAGPGFVYQDGEFIDTRPPQEAPPQQAQPETTVLYDHENRIRAIEGAPPLTLGEFIAKAKAG